jgi:rod shape-determining protein MreD
VIFTSSIVFRIAAIVFAGLLLQLAMLSQMTLIGTQPDIMPAIVASLAILAGSLPGAVIGFSTGLLIDGALIQPLGLSSLILLGVGYMAGRYRELYDISNSLIPALLVGALTLFAVLGFAILQLLLGVEAQVSPLVIRDMLVKSVLNLFLAVPVYLGIRRALRAALIEDTTPTRQLRRESYFGITA